MNSFTRHILLPAILPLIFFMIALSPVEVLGCRNRGLLALAVSLISGLSALGTAIIGVKGRIRGDSKAMWWVLSTLVLTIPVIAMIVLA
jgi:hypothetical protein